MMRTNVTFHPHDTTHFWVSDFTLYCYESEQIILKMKKQIDQLIMDKIEIAPKCADWESLLGESSATTNTVFPSAVPFTDNELGFVSPISRSFIRTVQHFITTFEKNNRDLSALRLGPEKWLKQKVVLGFSKIMSSYSR